MEKSLRTNKGDHCVGGQRPISRFFQAFVGILGLVAVTGAAHAQIQIMPMGDSITVGGGIGNGQLDSNGYAIQSGYRTELYTDLTGAHVNFQFTGATTTQASAQLTAAGDQYLNGYGSYTLGDIYTNLAGTTGAITEPTYGGAYNEGGYWMTGGGLRPAAYPNVVLLDGGANDVAYGESIGTIETNMDNILTWFSVNRPNTELLVANLYPNPYPEFPINANITAFNAWLAGTELPKFSKYHLVDLYDVMLPHPTTYYSTDNGHPDAAGYNAIGDAWFQAIEADVVPEPSAFGLTMVGFFLIGAAAWKSRRRSQSLVSVG